jgi:hypothetical protein
MFVQAGNIIGANIYRDDDKPLYKRGNRTLLIICGICIFLFYLVKVWFIWRNKQKDKIWDAMTQQEKDEYVMTTKDKGMQRKDFKFVH